MPKYDVEVLATVVPCMYTGELGIEADTEKEAKDLALHFFADDFDEDYRRNGLHMFKFMISAKEQPKEEDDDSDG